MRGLEITATLWPTMEHYAPYCKDARLDAIRLNTAMTNADELPEILTKGIGQSHGKKLYFDVKGRQIRVEEVLPNDDHLECLINHPIEVDTPTWAYFKAGADKALLSKVEGNKLIFEGGPVYNLRRGESINIKNPSLVVNGLFNDEQKAYLAMAMKFGLRRYMLSYTHSMDDITEMRKYVGGSVIIAKIEDLKGVKFVEEEYARAKNLGILTARGDLFAEVKRPHEIIQVTRKLVETEPRAILGSRILLSVTNEKTPSCSDISEVEWLLDIGYRRFMFCDGLCLNGESLDRAINVLQMIYDDYVKNRNYSLGKNGIVGVSSKPIKPWKGVNPFDYRSESTEVIDHDKSGITSKPVSLPAPHYNGPAFVLPNRNGGKPGRAVMNDKTVEDKFIDEKKDVLPEIKPVDKPIEKATITPEPINNPHNGSLGSVENGDTEAKHTGYTREHPPQSDRVHSPKQPGLIEKLRKLVRGE